MTSSPLLTPGTDELKLTPELLKIFASFKALGDGALAAIAADCSVQHYDDGELVIGHTDTSVDVLLLVSGAARVSLYSADGQRVGFIELPRGMMFGEISALDGLPRSASVGASESSIIAVAQQLAGHVRRLTTRVFEFSTMAVRQRLRAELLRLAKPAASGDTGVIASLPTHAELASRISTHREAVSRELAWLDDGGFVVKQGRNLLIPSLGKLRSLMEDGWKG